MFVDVVVVEGVLVLWGDVVFWCYVYYFVVVGV